MGFFSFLRTPAPAAEASQVKTLLTSKRPIDKSDSTKKAAAVPETESDKRVQWAADVDENDDRTELRRRSDRKGTPWHRVGGVAAPAAADDDDDDDEAEGRDVSSTTVARKRGRKHTPWNSGDRNAVESTEHMSVRWASEVEEVEIVTKNESGKEAVVARRSGRKGTPWHSSSENAEAQSSNHISVRWASEVEELEIDAPDEPSQEKKLTRRSGRKGTPWHASSEHAEAGISSEQTRVRWSAEQEESEIGACEQSSNAEKVLARRQPGRKNTPWTVVQQRPESQESDSGSECTQETECAKDRCQGSAASKSRNWSFLELIACLSCDSSAVHLTTEESINANRTSEGFNV